MSDQWYPEPSEEQVEAEQQEQSKITASMPVLQEVLDWYDTQIAVYSNPKTITGIGSNTKAEDVKQAVLFAQTLIQDYENKRGEFANRFEKFLKQEGDKT